MSQCHQRRFVVLWLVEGHRSLLSRDRRFWWHLHAVEEWLRSVVCLEHFSSCDVLPLDAIENRGEDLFFAIPPPVMTSSRDGSNIHSSSSSSSSLLRFFCIGI